MVHLLRCFCFFLFFLFIFLVLFGSTGMQRWKFFCFSWTMSMCFFKTGLEPNIFWQVLHLKFLWFSWTVVKCFFKSPLYPNDFLQMSHWKFFCFLCTMLMWVCMLSFCPKDLWQMLHSKYSSSFLDLIVDENFFWLRGFRLKSVFGKTWKNKIMYVLRWNAPFWWVFRKLLVLLLIIFLT